MADIARTEEAGTLEDLGLDVYANGFQDTDVRADDGGMDVKRYAAEPDQPLHTDVYQRFFTPLTWIVCLFLITTKRSDWPRQTRRLSSPGYPAMTLRSKYHFTILVTELGATFKIGCWDTCRL